MAEPGALDVRVLSTEAAPALDDDRLVDLIDGLLDRGVVLRGELWLSVAGIDLVFLGLDLVLASHETMTRGRR